MKNILLKILSVLDWRNYTFAAEIKRLGAQASEIIHAEKDREERELYEGLTLEEAMNKFNRINTPANFKSMARKRHLINDALIPLDVPPDYEPPDHGGPKFLFVGTPYPGQRPEMFGRFVKGDGCDKIPTVLVEGEIDYTPDVGAGMTEPLKGTHPPLATDAGPSAWVLPCFTVTPGQTTPAVGQVEVENTNGKIIVTLDNYYDNDTIRATFGKIEFIAIDFLKPPDGHDFEIDGAVKKFQIINWVMEV